MPINREEADDMIYALYNDEGDLINSFQDEDEAYEQKERDQQVVTYQKA